MKASYRMLHLMMTIAMLVPTAMGASDIYVKVVVRPTAKASRSPNGPKG